jgi:predicted nucleic acid-binding protein
MKLLVDANVILDVLLNRTPWVAESQAVWEANQQQRIQGHVVATTVTNLFYIARRLVGQSLALRGVRECLSAFDVIAVDGAILNNAVAMGGSDFEDDVAICCAVTVGMGFIVTRDAGGFARSPVPAVSPAELVAQLSQT